MDSFNLSKQELRILMLICSEKTNHEIAEELFISKGTVEWHKNKLIQKTGCKNSVGLVLFAIRQNIYRFN